MWSTDLCLWSGDRGLRRYSSSTPPQGSSRYAFFLFIALSNLWKCAASTPQRDVEQILDGIWMLNVLDGWKTIEMTLISRKKNRDEISKLTELSTRRNRCHSWRSRSRTRTSHVSRSSTVVAVRERLTVRPILKLRYSHYTKWSNADYARKRLVTQAKNK